MENCLIYNRDKRKRIKTGIKKENYMTNNDDGFFEEAPEWECWLGKDCTCEDCEKKDGAKECKEKRLELYNKEKNEKVFMDEKEEKEHAIWYINKYIPEMKGIIDFIENSTTFDDIMFWLKKLLVEYKDFMGDMKELDRSTIRKKKNHRTGIL
jgi:hypothetical protein